MPGHRVLENHTFLDVGSGDQAGVAGGCSHKHAGSLIEAPALGHRLQPLFGTRDMCGISALAGSKDSVADLEEGCAATRQGRGCFKNNARELRASNPREGWLVLVLAADLQQVEEVGCRGVDGNQILIVLGSGIWKRLDLEVIWSLVMSIRMGRNNTVVAVAVAVVP
jgi:hypothetical protein